MPETSGTWTGATQNLAVAVYRAALAPIGVSGNGVAVSSGGATSSTISYSALTPTTYPAAAGTHWYAAFAAHQAATNVEIAPTGMGNRAAAGTDETVVHDTGGPVSTNWPLTTVGVNAAGGWFAFMVQVPASGTVSRVGAAAGNGSSIAIPAGHQVGDLILICAFRLDGTPSQPTTPAGFTNLVGSSRAAVGGGNINYRIATVADTAPFTPTISVY